MNGTHGTFPKDGLRICTRMIETLLIYSYVFFLNPLNHGHNATYEMLHIPPPPSQKKYFSLCYRVDIKLQL